MKTLLEDLDAKIKEPIPIYEDNQSVIFLTKSRQINKRLKHIEIKYCFVRNTRNEIQRNIFTLKYLNTSEQTADTLTKPLPVQPFNKHRQAFHVERRLSSTSLC